MTTRLPHAFLLSGSLHAAAIAGLVWFGWSVARPEQPTLSGGKLVLVPSPSSPATSGTTSSSPSTVKFIAPTIPRSALLPVPATPVVPDSPATASPTLPKPADRPIKPAGPKAPSANQVAQSSATTPPGTPRINVGELVEGLRAPGGSADTADQAVALLMAGYFAALKDRALAAYVRPPGVPEGLAVRIGFQLSAEGVLSRIEILRSSGSRDFDSAVLAAFRTVRVRPRPDRLTDEREMTFRTADLAP